MEREILRVTEAGFYCSAGDFYIDPWQPVERAVITHCHSDHARPGSGKYLVAAQGSSLFRDRLAPGSALQTLEYGERLRIGDAVVSLHPAGHILGSSQVRIEFRGETWVISGDYKVQSDGTCTSFELEPCHTFVTESTFGLPVFRWPEPERVFEQINGWWRKNQKAGKTSLLFAYAVGKAQRVIRGVDSSIGPIFGHGAVCTVCDCYREEGVSLPPVCYTRAAPATQNWPDALVVAPPSAQASPWIRRFGPVSTAFVSGWMTIRGLRRRRSVDRGFVLSDHVDWDGLMGTICSTGAERIWVSHGYTGPVVRSLKEKGLEAVAVPSRFPTESEEPSQGR